MIRPEPGLDFLPGLVLLRPLGRGGMGEAWLARDEERGEDVVAKILPADAPSERVALLRREARLVRKLTHPGIVPVYGFRTGDNGSAVTLQYMPGGDAGQLRGRPPLEVVRVARQVASALEYLHGLGVVHRDVKPPNVLLDAEGQARLADFGIAAAAAMDEEGVVLRGGGSRASVSPQQLAGGPADPADDLYALGVLLFEMLSGRPPFPSHATDEQIRAAVPPPVASPFPLPEALRALVAALLAKEPADRPASMAAVVERLVRIEAELAVSTTATARSPVRLEPPPRPEAALVRPVVPETRAGLAKSRRPGGPPLQIVLLSALAFVALLVVVVLPRWARPPAAPASAAEPSPAPSPDAGRDARDPIAAPEGPASAASPTAAEPDRPPAEANPTPPAATPPAAAAPPPVTRPAPAGSAPEPAFAEALSVGEAALARGEWDAAQKAFERARGLRPGAPAVADGLQRVSDARRAETLTRHREAGRALEAKEDWRAALVEYQAALGLEPGVAFAVEGRDRAAARDELAARLAFHATHPGRLAVDEVAREAEALLERARQVPSPGARHRAQIAALEKALAEARTPVTVVIESDGLTELVLSRVGRLGTVKRRALELRPGTYTVVGTRRGYRDVRRQFNVEPGMPAITVRCEEAI